MRSRSLRAFGLICLAPFFVNLACNSSAGMTGFVGGGGSSGTAGTGGGNNDASTVVDTGGGSDAIAASTGCGMPAPGDPAPVAANHNYAEFTLSVTAQAAAVYASQPAMAYDRLFYVRLPDGYDPSKPYKVIYLGPGCGVAQDSSPTMRKGYPFDTDPIATDAKSNAILVQMEQGFYNPAEYNSATCVKGTPATTVNACQYCFDDWASLSSIPDAADKIAMEKAYFDALHKEIEAKYCVDKNRQFFAGYSSGGWLAQQLGCWFPDVLRAQANVTGGLPPPIKANVAGANDYCVQHPIAAFLIHDSQDVSNRIGGSQDAASRLFALNGCTGTFSVPPVPNSTAPLPDGMEEYTISGVANTGVFRCYKYTTCPVATPMVFCVSTDSQHGDQSARAVPAFWEFFSSF